MNNTLKGYWVGVLSTVLLISSIAYAKTGTETIQALYNNIKVYVDGVKVDTRDVNGNSVEPFINNGTTYLPVRAIGEAFGKQVTWDGATQSVYVGEKPGDKQYLMDVCPLYDGRGCNSYLSADGNTVKLGGKNYTNAFSLGYDYYVIDPTSYALFNLDGKYKKFNFKVGRVDETHLNDATLNIYLDGDLAKQIDISATDLPKEVELDLEYAMQIKFEIKNGEVKYAVVDAVLE